MALLALHNFLPAALIFLVWVRAVESATAPVVDLGYAQYEGVVDTKLNITAFRGIRYAAPPTGQLRWQAPTPPSNASGIQQAYNDPPHLRIAYSSVLFTRSEFYGAFTDNCLDPRWHYILGSASQYNGADLVQESNREVVVVVIQYRLGLFGFLAGQQIKDGGALNAGLLDQDFALRWVHHNIHKFGGDPTKVTIWGESAGAGSVLQHLVAHNGNTSPQLFRAAITSSTFMPSQYQYNHRIPQTLFNDVAALAGCNVTRPLDCLRGVDSATMEDINLSMIIAGFQGTSTFVPVVDGSFITQSPTDLLRQGKLNGDVLLSVINTNEGPLFVNQSLDYDVAEYARNLFPLFGSKESNAVASTYQSLGSPLDQVNAIMGDRYSSAPRIAYGCLPRGVIQGRIRDPSRFAWPRLVNYFPSFTAFNSSLIYNNTAFITPLRWHPPVWQKWSPAETEMRFNKTELGTPHIVSVKTSDALLKRCELWTSLRHLTAQ
ncbi:Alpha/Beta hydrolase protein [Mycena leptocephala]|nr:Alpha/Beta hydrolase protein [Mycena leptocephala]